MLLRTLRVRANLTQEQVAEGSGVSVRTIGRRPGPEVRAPRRTRPPR
ncbi:helix-turn-helix domain-containing protein [Streptomyces sp. NPDC091259]